MKEKILIVGNNVRNVVQSAFKAGYEVYALTKFLDSDLLLFCEKAYPIEDDSHEWVKKRTEELINLLEAKVILTSGYEDLKVRAEILGCEPRAIDEILNKLKFYRRLERAGLPFPEILDRTDERCIIKPIRGGGGEDIKVVEGGSQADDDKIIGKKFLVQRLIDGFPCSASVIVGREARVIALNEILAGWSEMNASGFRYCGNITPLTAEKDTRKQLVSLAREVCDLFELRGSVGVDFVVDSATMAPYILEINPRFQGSLDSIEWSTDLNIFSLHMRALYGKEAPEKVDYYRYAIRAISFTGWRLRIINDLTGNPFFADVPTRGTIYEKDEPLVSILASGYSRREVVEKTIKRRRYFLKLQGT